jgi:hypothetical protein
VTVKLSPVVAALWMLLFAVVAGGAYVVGHDAGSTTRTVVDVVTVTAAPQLDATAQLYAAAQLDATAQSNVRSAIPAAEAWYQDTAGGNSAYTGLSNANLAKEAPGVSPKVGVKVLGSGAAYCLFDDEAAGHGAYYVGGDSTKVTQSSPAAAVATVTKVNGASATGGADACNALS